MVWHRNLATVLYNVRCNVHFVAGLSRKLPLRGLLGVGSGSSSLLLSESKSMAASEAADATADGLRPAGIACVMRHTPA